MKAVDAVARALYETMPTDKLVTWEATTELQRERFRWYAESAIMEYERHIDQVGWISESGNVYRLGDLKDSALVDLACQPIWRLPR